MKYLAWITAALVFSLLGCAPSLEKQSPAVTPAMAARSGTSEGDLQVGRAVYIAHCGRCHEYQLPDTVSSADWHVVVPGMAWNAGLSKHDEIAVQQYLLAARLKQ